jgi:DNA polymerase iota
MNVSDIVEYNANILSSNHLNNSFFCLSKVDPTVGFPFDATRLAGHAYPDTAIDTLGKLETKAAAYGVAQQ